MIQTARFIEELLRTAYVGQIMDIEPPQQEGEVGEGAAPEAGDAERYYTIPWEPGQCRSCGAWFQKAGALTKHHRTVHSEIPLGFECGMCSRVFPGSHAALCHYSKCGGARVEELPNVCDLCNRGYRSASGLSQHRRHMHPEARIQERMAARGPRRPAGRSRTIWSEAEEDAVIEFGLDQGFTGTYAPRLAEIIPGKSLKQIRDKVRMLRLAGSIPLIDPGEVAAREEVESESPASASDVSEGGLVEEFEVSVEDEVAAFEVDEWERNPRDEWLRTDPRNPLAEELQGGWDRNEKPDEVWLEGFIGRVTAACLASGNVNQLQRTRRGAKPKGREAKKVCRHSRNV